MRGTSDVKSQLEELGSGAGRSDVDAIALELRAIYRADWRDHESFDFAAFPRLASRLKLSEDREGVKELRVCLAELVREAKDLEKLEPLPHGRSYAKVWTALFALDEQWLGTSLKERREWVRQQWTTELGGPIKTVDSLRQNFEPRFLRVLAARLIEPLGEDTPPERAVRRSAPKKLLAVEPAPWPVRQHSPTSKQEIVILTAAPAMRHGPASGLVKLVREFEPYWRAADMMIYSPEGTYKEIWRAGLLHNYAGFATLPAGFFGGLVHATEIVVAAAEAKPKIGTHVVYLIDPHDDSSLYPATAAIKRECLLTKTPFLTTQHGAARWFRLEWARRAMEDKGPCAQELLLTRPAAGFPDGSGLDDARYTVAFAAHDRHKRAMMEFADHNAELVEQYFPERWATRVTGHLLNGGSIFDQEYELDIRYDVNGQRRDELMSSIEEKTFQWELDKPEQGPGSSNWVGLLTRGRQGGVVQLARKVLNNECDTVIFFQDAETPREHDMEIQVLDRAAQLAHTGSLLLYDDESATRWADNLSRAESQGPHASAISLVDAYRRVFDVELVLAHRDANSQQSRTGRKGSEETLDTWRRITLTAATHLSGALHSAKDHRLKRGEPVRLGFPWGAVIRDVLGDLTDKDGRYSLAGALRLHDFVAGHSAAELYEARGIARSNDRWPLEPSSSQLFAQDQLRIVPTVGVIGARDRMLEAHALVNRAVAILGGEAVAYPESAFALVNGRENLLASAPKKDWAELDVLVLHAAPLIERPNKDPTALATGLPADLASHYEGSLGAIGTIYLERDGDKIRQVMHDSYMQVGIGLDEIQDLKANGAEVILVNGAEKNDYRRRAAWAALKSGVASTFITDEAFAWEVLKEELDCLGKT